MADIRLGSTLLACVCVCLRLAWAAVVCRHLCAHAFVCAHCMYVNVLVHFFAHGYVCVYVSPPLWCLCSAGDLYSF